MSPTRIFLRPPLDVLVQHTHGIITTPELHRAGYTDDEIRTLVRRRQLIRIRRGVYAVGHQAFGVEARRMVVVRCAGDGALVSSISAGLSWRLTHRHERRVDGVVPRKRRSVPDGNITMDSRIPRSAGTTWRGIPILTPTWSIVTMAPRMEPGELARVLREASFHRHLDMAALSRIVDDGNRVGIDTLRRALDLRMIGSDGYASRLEANVNRYVNHRVAEPALANVVVPVSGDSLRVDMVWRSIGVCCEIDGPLHDDPDVRRDDARRTALLEAAGLVVLRIHWTDWEADRAAATRALLEFVSLRLAERNRHR